MRWCTLRFPLRYRQGSARVLLIAGAVLLNLIPSAARDSYQQPFSVNSPWNMPLGDGAVYQTVPGISGLSGGLNYAEGWSTGIYRATPDDRQARLYIHDSTLWTRLYNGEVLTTGNSLQTEDSLRAASGSTIGFPANYYSTTVPAISGSQRTWPDSIRDIETGWTTAIYVPSDVRPSPDTDAHLAIWQPGGLVLECYCTVACANGDIITTMAGFSDPAGDGTGFNNGRNASLLNNYAGKIRRGEITAGVIPHALTGVMSRLILTTAVQWPAFTFDMDDRYEGTLPMGALLALPPGLDIDSLDLSAQGQVIARAARDYGIYIVDRGGDGGLTLQASLDADDCLGSMYPESQRAADITKIVQRLEWVSNNGPDSIGGGGSVRRAPLAEPLELAGFSESREINARPFNGKFSRQVQGALYNLQGERVMSRRVSAAGIYLKMSGGKPEKLMITP